MATNILKRSMNQTAVYWNKGETDGEGYASWSSDFPIEHTKAVRWENTQQQFIDTDGRESLSQAIVYTAQDVQEGGYYFLGELTDLDSAEDPQTQDGAYLIKAVTTVPSLRGRATALNRVFLGKKGI